VNFNSRESKSEKERERGKEPATEKKEQNPKFIFFLKYLLLNNQVSKVKY